MPQDTPSQHPRARPADPPGHSPPTPRTDPDTPPETPKFTLCSSRFIPQTVPYLLQFHTILSRCQCKPEPAPRTQLAAHPYPPALCLNKFLGDRQPQPRPIAVMR